MIENNRITSYGQEFLENADIPIRLAVHTQSGWPIVMSLWFLYKQGNFYCATIKSAKIIKYASKDNRCAFEIARDSPPYKGIRGQGRIIIDLKNGEIILKALLDKYNVRTDSKLTKFLMSRIEDEVVLIIKPNQLYSWDFSNRMKDAFKKRSKK